jgi:carotenoid cleavage dioxygenase
MVAFGYEATGLATDDLFICTIDRTGKVRHEVRVKVPYVSIIHDMALTHRHVVIPFSGYVTSLERLQAGKIHWGWDSTKPGYIGVMPREGSAKDMRWFKGPNRCHMHTFNAYSDGNKVILYAPFWDSNFFPFFPNVDGSPFDPAKARAFVRKFTLDLDSSSDAWQEELLWDMPVVDIGKVDPRTLSLPSRYIYTGFTDPQMPYDRERSGPRAPATVPNSYGRFDIQTRRIDRYFAGKTHGLQECTFVPRGTAEGQGYLIGVASNYAQMRSELIIADAEHLGDGDVARVILPFRLSSQVHGTWAGKDELPLV